MIKQWRVCLAIVALGLSAGCGGGQDEKTGRLAGAPVAVSVATVERSVGSDHEEVMGTVVPRNRADIQSKVQGRVEEIHVTLGSIVAAGQILAQLDSRDLLARADQARAVSRQAAVELIRYDSLLSRKLVSQQEYDAIKARADVAGASLAEAEALLSYARIASPFAGKVTEKNIDIGDLAVPGKSLFVVEEDAAPRLEVNVPESRRGVIGLGDTLPIILDPGSMRVSGRVVEISPAANALTRSFVVKLEIPRAGGARGGQFGRLLLTSAGQSGLLIPAEALIRRGQLEIVFAVTADHHAQVRLVRSGKSIDSRIEILAGLRDGEQVVTNGGDQLSDGDSLEIRL